MAFRSTTEVIDRFNRAFVDRDRDLLMDLVAEDCVMESVQPAPAGERVTGRQACLDWWGALVDDHTSQFEPQEVVVAGERATIRWNYRYGPLLGLGQRSEPHARARRPDHRGSRLQQDRR